MPNLPEPRRREPPQPALLKAAVSPTAVAAVAAGALIGLLAHSVVLAVLLAVCAWGVRMVAAAVRRRAGAGRPHPARLDPWSVPEPWRQLLQQALAAQNRFDQTVSGWPPGPTRERLEALQPRVYQELAQLEATARHGAAAAGWTGARIAPGRPGREALTAELKSVQAERARLAGSAPGRAAELDRREEAVAAQLRAAHRADQAEAELHDRLSRAVARLDETVSELLVMEAPATVVEPTGVSSALDELSDGVSALRAAIAETAGTPPDTGTP